MDACGKSTPVYKSLTITSFSQLVNALPVTFNSLRPSDAYMHQLTRSTLVMRSTLPLWVFVLAKPPSGLQQLGAPLYLGHTGGAPCWPACMAGHAWQGTIFRLSPWCSADTKTLALIFMKAYTSTPIWDLHMKTVHMLPNILTIPYLLT